MLIGAGLVAAAPLAAGPLLTFDFNQPGQWPGVPTAARGTVDQADSTAASGAVVIVAAPGETVTRRSGLLAVRNAEGRLDRLTLSFDHATSAARPFVVRIESFDADRRRTGGREATIYPAAANFFQRSALELGAMRASGAGAFSATDAWVEISFAAAGAVELRIDNLAYASPAFYVSPAGRDSNDGRSEATALATPQAALEAARPGDIVLLCDGDYARPAGQPPGAPVARFVRPGTPAGWIVLKNCPGHSPVLSAAGQPAVAIVAARAAPILAYLEVRGLHVRGDAAERRAYFAAHPAERPAESWNGIVASGCPDPTPKQRDPRDLIHHIRVADNTVERCSSGGIFLRWADWLYIEHNTVRDNCWASAFDAPAGLTLMGYANFDAQDNVPKILIAGNRASGNRVYVPNYPEPPEPRTKFFNGNGLLLDANAWFKQRGTLARTLVQNNLVFDNGGCGIQMWGCHRLDVVNNTVWHNGTTPELRWGQVGFTNCKDIRFANNIVVAQPDRPLDTWKPGQPDRNSTGIERRHNLYWGGMAPPVAGEGDIVADPGFVDPATDPARADFHLRPDSPARRAGRPESFSPLVDLSGAPRPAGGAADLGVFQH